MCFANLAFAGVSPESASLPHLVTVSKVGQMDDFHSLAYMHLTAYLAAAIVELHDTVLRQQAEIDALKVK